MGAPDKSFDVKMSLIGMERCQIRDQALEAARIASNRYMMKKVGRRNYHLRIRVKPYHYLRENKMLTGAGADRVQDGMRLAFGRVVGLAARTDSDQPLISVRCNVQNIDDSKAALNRAAHKLPTPCRIAFDKIDSDIKRSLGYGVD
jgi:large subunit ribosomal protein L10e